MTWRMVHSCAAAFLFRFFDGVGPVAGGFPLDGLIRPGGFRDEGDLVGNDEGAVESHAELADQLRC